MADKTVFIALGQHYWEKRDTADAALKAVKHRLAGGGMTPPQYKLYAYAVHPDTVVNGMGGFTHPKDSKPELVKAVLVTKKTGRMKELDLAYEQK